MTSAPVLSGNQLAGTLVEGKQLAETLAEFIVNCRYEDLPKETIAKVKEYIIDVVGCIVGGSQEHQAELLLEVMKQMGGAPESSVFAHGFKTSTMNAALINGTMGHLLDFDDDHREGTMHPTVVVFPAAFALGEKLEKSGKELIRSLVLGLEVMIRIGETFLGKSYYQGFHPTGTCGVFGAAAACAALLGLDAKRTTYALGLAGSFTAGTQEWSTEGAWQKPLQAGHPAMFGILSALLAEKQFIGARTVLEGPNGFIRAHSFKNIFDYGRITKSLGTKWEMMDTSIKVHACCRFSGPVADCALDLYRQGVRAKDVRRIVAKVCDFSIRTLCTPAEPKYRPVTHVDAQFSIPYAIAVAICKNRTGPEEFNERSLGDPEVLELASKVVSEVDPEAEAVYPEKYPATLVATLENGREVGAHVDYPKGDPENPVSTNEIIDKFNYLSAQYLDQERRHQVIDKIMKLEQVRDVSALGRLLR
jgi:2-methylcitrate dehydratase PrpD